MTFICTGPNKPGPARWIVFFLCLSLARPGVAGVGDVIWSRTFNGSGSFTWDWFSDTAVDSLGNVYAVGDLYVNGIDIFVVKLSPDGRDRKSVV